MRLALVALAPWATAENPAGGPGVGAHFAKRPEESGRGRQECLRHVGRAV